MCKVINLFGEPGCGKSTLAAYIYYRLKMLGYNCELVTEFAKDKVYENSINDLENQSYIFGQQLQRMNRLKGKVDIIITDSPILLCGLYMKDEKIYNSFFNLVYDTFNSWNNHNYLLERIHEYVKSGRIHNEEDAQKIRQDLIASLDHYKIPYKSVVSRKSFAIGSQSILNTLTEFVSIPDIPYNEAGEKIISDVIRDMHSKFSGDGNIELSHGCCRLRIDKPEDYSKSGIFMKIKSIINIIIEDIKDYLKR